MLSCPGFQGRPGWGDGKVLEELSSPSAGGVSSSASASLSSPSPPSASTSPTSTSTSVRGIGLWPLLPPQLLMRYVCHSPSLGLVGDNPGVATPTGTGTRRAVQRSERFMEWQRELSRSVSAVRKLGHTSALLTTERHSSDEDNVKMHRHEGSEEREGEGEGEEPGADSQGGADAAAANQRQRGKKTQHQRQRSDAKKPRKEDDGDPKKSALPTIKEAAVPAESEGGRMRRCKQQVNQPAAVRRPAPQVPTQQQVPQPLARRRQRRQPRSFTPPKEDVERGLRSLTRNRGSEAVPAATTAVPTNSTKGATKRSKRVAQRLANEEPAPPPLKLPKLHLVLTRKEIQEDWLKITGHKYTGKPRKSTLIQRGLGLCTALTCPSSIRYLNEPQSVQVP